MKALLLAACLFITTGLYAQRKVAIYATGKPGTDTWEEFRFGVDDARPSVILYTYGSDRRELTLEYRGEAGVKGQRRFRVGFPNGLVLYVSPVGNRLRIADGRGKYNKIFAWEYEGPTNGISTACDACAADEKEAMVWMKTFYL